MPVAVVAIEGVLAQENLDTPIASHPVEEGVALARALTAGGLQIVAVTMWAEHIASAWLARHDLDVLQIIATRTWDDGQPRAAVRARQLAAARSAGSYVALYVDSDTESVLGAVREGIATALFVPPRPAREREFTALGGPPQPWEELVAEVDRRLAADT